MPVHMILQQGQGALVDGHLQHTFTVTPGNQQSLSGVWESMKSLSGVGINSHCQVCGNQQSLSGVWESMKSLSGVWESTVTVRCVGINSHCQVCGNQQSLSGVWESTVTVRCGNQ